MAPRLDAAAVKPSQEAPPVLEATVLAVNRHPATSEGLFERQPAPPGEPVGVGLLGIEGSADFNSSRRWDGYGLLDYHRGERAVSVQTSANLAELRDAALALKDALTEADFQPGVFGENVFLDSAALSAARTCVGDEFVVVRAGREHRLRLQVSSPRCPCAKIDDRMGKTYTACGTRAHCAATGHAGFFFRVLEPGDIMTGDVLKLVARPYPSWDLARMSQLLFGHPIAVMNYKVRGKKAFADRTTPSVLREEWMGTDAELRELASIPELAILEWREHLWRMLGWPDIGRYRKLSRFPSLDPKVLGVVGLIITAGLAIGASRLLSQRSK